MKFSLSTDPTRHSTTIVAEPAEYDAWPLLPTIDVSAMPYRIHPDRAAVACSLIFHGSVSGSFAITPPCSPHVASALRAWFAPVDIHVMDIEFVPGMLAAGDATMHVSADLMTALPSSTDVDAHDVMFHVLPEGAGFLASRAGLWVISNALLLARDNESPLKRLLPALGLAILFAEDFLANAVALTDVDLAHDPETAQKLRALLDATGIQLRG
jgi:hypothetical protein